MATERLFNDDCLDIMENVLEENSIDTIITDPPYGLEFMGKGWDKGVPDVSFWGAMLTIAKPGTTLLSFGGTRTYHRLAVAIEDAGWQIRDCLMWLYGSGFPKSHNLHGQFEGWGTALKPAWEPIIVAMKPLDGTFAENAERWGVAGINIDGSRIGSCAESFTDTRIDKVQQNAHGKYGTADYDSSKGRWPADLLLDEEAATMLDRQSGDRKSGGIGGTSRFFYTAKASKSERNAGLEKLPLVECKTGCGGGDMPIDDDGNDRDRFKKKAQNFHPTVKPLKLMEYLCTLTKTPTGGVVLDPFMGSGTTGLACKNIGRSFIGIEKEAEYFKIAEARINAG